MARKIKMKLRSLIESRNITQKQLAQMTGLRESTISSIARNAQTAINYEHLSKIAEALEIQDIRELIDFE